MGHLVSFYLHWTHVKPGVLRGHGDLLNFKTRNKSSITLIRKQGPPGRPLSAAGGPEGCALAQLMELAIKAMVLLAWPCGSLWSVLWEGLALDKVKSSEI